MIRQIGTTPEVLDYYDHPQKVVFTVKTAGESIIIATNRLQLSTPIGGTQQGTTIADTDGKIALDVEGEIYWVGSVDPVVVDVLETGAI